MQKLILSILVLLAIPFNSFAATLEAKPLADLITAMQNTKFEYKETDLIFGYDQIRSCLFVSDSMVVIKNYCYPKKTYPAKGYTIISAKFGMIDLYQEDMSDVLQRDVMITAFPDAVAPYLPASMKTMTIAKLNTIMEDLYYKYPPACWSTNHSFYTKAPEVKCNVTTTEVSGFQEWATETQTLTLDEAAWLKLVKNLDTLF